MNDLIEYRVTWTKLPRNKNDGRVLFVRAESSEAASAIAMDHIERKFGITNFVVDGAKQSERVPNGKVVEIEE